jgi:PST family polysaccharide transporter
LPAEYGLVGYAVTVMSFLDAVRDLGLGLTLIQRRGEPEEIAEAADTAFWLGLGSNTLIWVLSILFAPSVASFFRAPELVYILPILCFSFILNSFGSIHDALLQREMKFRKRMIPDVWSSILKGIISVGLALAGQGVWALIIGQIIGRLVYSILIWRVNPYRPQRRFNPRIARELLGFGSKLSLDSFISALQANIDYVFIGRFLGDAALGLYTIAYRVPELIIINFCIVIATVLFPAYSELEDKEELKEAMLGAFHYVSLVTIPVGVGLALISPLFVSTFLGPEWVDAGPMMSLLSLYGMTLAISWNIGDVYKALKRGDILWKTSLVEFIFLAIVLLLMAQVSALYVSIGHLLVAFTVTVLRLIIVMGLLKIPRMSVIQQFSHPVTGSIVMGITTYLVIIATATLPSLISLVLAVLAGVISYACALWFLERALVLQAIEILTDRLPFLDGIVKLHKN